MRKHLFRFIVLGICALPVLGFVVPAISTYLHIVECRTRILPGMSVAELRGFAGKPALILHRGEKLLATRRSDMIPNLDAYTAIHFYQKEGIPYYNIYVFIDERQSTVIRAKIENLWW